VSCTCADFDEHARSPIHHDVRDGRRARAGAQEGRSLDIVADVGEELFLFGDGHHHALDGDDLVDDIADFLARRIDVELRELRQIDGIDQGAENRRFNLVIIVEPVVDGDVAGRAVGTRFTRRFSAP